MCEQRFGGAHAVGRWRAVGIDDLRQGLDGLFRVPTGVGADSSGACWAHVWLAASAFVHALFSRRLRFTLNDGGAPGTTSTKGTPRHHPGVIDRHATAASTEPAATVNPSGR